MNDVERQFLAKGIVRGGELFLDGPNALDFIEATRREGISIAGIESFILECDKTFPLLGQILTCAEDPAFNPWDEARRFITERLNKGYSFIIETE